jgi:predicted transcriptional regulator
MSLALVLVILMALPLASLSPQPWGNGANDTLSLASGESQIIYPQSGLSRFDAAPQFAEQVFSAFGKVQGGESLPTIPFKSEQLLFFWWSSSGSDLFGTSLDCQAVAFRSTDDSLLHLYYNVPENGGGFVAFVLTLHSSGIFAPSTAYHFGNSSHSDPLLEFGKTIADRLGIPSSDLEGGRSGGNQTTVKNTTTLRYTNAPIMIGGYPAPAHGFNTIHAAVDFASGELVEVWGTPFVVPLPRAAVDVREAITVGSQFVNNTLLKPTERIFTSGIAGMGIMPEKERVGFIYEYIAHFGDPVACNYSYESQIISFSKSSEAVVFIDIAAGEVRGYSSGGVSVLLREAGHRFVEGQWVLGIALMAVVPIAAMAIMYLSPETGMAMLSVVILPLWIRLRGANILDNFNRGRILGFINARPGVTYSELKSSLGIGNGTLAYHLMVLDKLEFIRSVREGRQRRFYPDGASDKLGRSHHLGLTESRIFDELTMRGPMTVSHIADALGMSRQRVHHNIRLLDKRGLAEREGSAWRVAGANHGSDAISDEGPDIA